MIVLNQHTEEKKSENPMATFRSNRVLIQSFQHTSYLSFVIDDSDVLNFRISVDKKAYCRTPRP